jgi:16S rRNA U516 pseudouridylate synthase RsuA-like enzyme
MDYRKADLQLEKALALTHAVSAKDARTLVRGGNVSVDGVIINGIDAADTVVCNYLTRTFAIRVIVDSNDVGNDVDVVNNDVDNDDDNHIDDAVAATPSSGVWRTLPSPRRACYYKMYKPRNCASSNVPGENAAAIALNLSGGGCVDVESDASIGGVVGYATPQPAALCLPVSARRGVYHVGRLDVESEGLLCWTDDGTFTRLLTAPVSITHVPKTTETATTATTATASATSTTATAAAAGVCKLYHVLVEGLKHPHQPLAFDDAILKRLTTDGADIGDKRRGYVGGASDLVTSFICVLFSAAP